MQIVCIHALHGDIDVFVVALYGAIMHVFGK